MDEVRLYPQIDSLREVEELLQREVIDLHPGTAHDSRAGRAPPRIRSNCEGRGVPPAVRPWIRQHLVAAEVVGQPAPDDRRAPGNAVREPALRAQDAAQLPASHRRSQEPVLALEPGEIPHEGPNEYVRHIEIERAI